MLGVHLSRSMPTPLVLLPWGSKSTSNVRFSAAPRHAARLIAVVVLPTPPFWFATAMMLPIADRVRVRLLRQLLRRYHAPPSRHKPGARSHFATNTCDTICQPVLTQAAHRP